MNNNGNRPRRSSGKGILDMHPTQLRRGEGADISPEQLNILKIKTEDRIAAAKYAQMNEKLRKASHTEQMNNVYTEKNNVRCCPHIPQNERSSDQRTDSVNGGYMQINGTEAYKTEFGITSVTGDTVENGNKSSAKKSIIIVGIIVAVLVAAVCAFILIYMNTDNNSDNGHNAAEYTERSPTVTLSIYNNKDRIPFIYDLTNT